MSEWHNSSCRRLDVFTNGGISSCLSCGSVQTEPDLSSSGDEDIYHNIYQTLNNTKDIRLLTLEPGEYEDPLNGNLHLTTTSGFLRYDAISYTWGGEDEQMERSGSIMLNSRRFPVTPNCEAALRRVRSQGSKKTIWIDAICINQDDLQERGHQVRLMQKIYSRADHVLVYLGESSPKEDDLLNFLSGQSLRVSEDTDPHLLLQAALCTLFRRRYFSRVWVLQEVALARQATLICGRHSIPWSLMEIPRLGHIGLLDYSKDDGYFLGLSGLDRLPPVLELRAPAYRDPKGLLELLEATLGSRASDPRDKVFALFGLLTCPESDGLVADYTKTTAEVYTSVAIWIAQNFGLPSLLSRTCVLQQRLAVEHQVPQWVPNWAYDGLQRLDWGLTYEQESEGLARLPVSVCMRDTTAIKFPALLIGTAAQVLRLENLTDYSVFVPTPSTDGNCFSAMSREFLIKTMGRLYRTKTSGEDYISKAMGKEYYVTWNGPFIHFIHLNYGVNRQKTDDGQAQEQNGPSHSAIAEDTMEVNSWIRDLVYLIPQPRDDGFDFTEPGCVSVDELGPRTWIHKDNQGKETTGRFSAYAVCCSEHHEGGSTRIYLRGLLKNYMRHRPASNRFEFVSAR